MQKTFIGEQIFEASGKRGRKRIHPVAGGREAGLGAHSGAAILLFTGNLI